MSTTDRELLIRDTLSALADADSYDVNLRDNSEAWEVMEKFARAIETELEKRAPDSFEDWLDECDESGSTIQHRIECAGLNEIMSWVERAFAAGRDSVEPRWQPIESAPKDGTNVLLFNNAGHVAAGLWLDGMLGTGWFLRGGNKPNVFFNEGRVTHWMPLPEPPAAQGGDGGCNE